MATLTTLFIVCVFSMMCSEAGFLSNITANFMLPSLPNPFSNMSTDENEEPNNLDASGSVIKSEQDKVVNITKKLDTRKSIFSGVSDKIKKKIKAIYPGTRWCGDGNKAQSEDDLGLFSETDNCCREHDHCPDNIPAYGFKHNLTNTGKFTKSHCDCDQKFYKCLKAADNVIAFQVGTTYFTVLGPHCFKEEYPILSCQKHKGVSKRCIKYEFDNSTEKIYQWFDNPEY